MSSSIAQKVDTQARVIRSLNLIHCSDTQHMVGAVELERLLNLEATNRELVQRMKDDGDYICTLSERCERYRDALLKHKAENHRLTDKIQQLYEGAEEQKRTIKRLEEFVDQLTNPKFTREDLPKEALLQRIKLLEEAGDALKAAGYFGGFNDAVNRWVKVKEEKP